MRILLLACSMLLVSCALPAIRDTGITQFELLSGTALFGEPVSVDELPEYDILGLDDDMRAFVAEHVRRAPYPARVRRLMRGMDEVGLLELDYDAKVTLTARETYHQRVGNCLAFTNLFVALAREAGLDVSFQMVDVPPSWVSAGSDYVAINNHINAVVHIRLRPDYLVDFNISRYREGYDQREVGDSYAFALFYSNLAVAEFDGGVARRAFAYLKKAIETNPKVAGVWVNLGVLYSRSELYPHAIAAYERALEIDGRNKSALTNLSRIFAYLGKVELAEAYERRIRRYRNRNPYYHYHLAAIALDEERFDDAVDHVERAIRLKSSEYEFHYLRGLVYTKIGKSRVAAESMRTAESLLGDEERLPENGIEFLRTLY